MIVGGLTIGVIFFLWMVLPSIGALSYQRPPVRSDTGLIAFVTDSASANVEAWTRVQGADPSNEKPISMYFSFSTSVLPETFVQVSSRGGGPENLSGQSVVLGGDIASSLIDCGDSGIVVLRDVVYDDLNVTQQRAAVEYYLNTRPSQDQSDSDSEIATAVEEQRAAEIALKHTYTVLYPSSFSRYTARYSTGDDTFTEFDSDLAQFTCTFAHEGYWSSDGDYLTLRQPTLMALSRGEENQPGNADIHRWFSVVEPPFIRLSSSSAIFEREWSGLLEFEVREFENDLDRPFVAIEGFEAQFFDEVASKERKNAIYIGGIGVGLLAGLALPIATACILLLTRYSPLRKWFHPDDEDKAQAEATGSE